MGVGPWMLVNHEDCIYICIHSAYLFDGGEFVQSNSLRESQHTPGLEHTLDIPKPPNERNSSINCWLGVWGMLQGSVGKFLETAMNEQ